MKEFHIYVRERNGIEITSNPAWVNADRVDFQRTVTLPFQGNDRDLNYLTRRLHDRLDTRITLVTEQTPVALLIGRTLFGSFILKPPTIRNAFDQYSADCLAQRRKKRICLHLPDTLYDLPWEVLHDPRDPDDNFIALNGSVVRYDS